MQRVILVIAGVFVVASCAPAVANGQELSVTTSVEPSQLSLLTGEDVRFRVTMVTGGDPERFVVFARTPRIWPEASTPLYGPVDVAFDGPVLLGHRLDVDSLPACSSSGYRPWHGVAPQDRGQDIAMPANVQATMTLTYRTAPGFAPWPGTDLGVRFDFRRRLPDGTLGTLQDDFVVRSEEPVAAHSRSGVRLHLHTRPTSRRGGRPRVVPVRSRVAIRGSTLPNGRGGSVALRAVRLDSRAGPRVIRIARARVESNGRFAHRSWRPRVPGLYELWALFRSRGAADTSLQDDWRCPNVLRVRRRT